MTTYYNLGNEWTAKVEKTSSGYYKTTVKDGNGKDIYEAMHSNELNALREVLSYCECDNNEED